MKLKKLPLNIKNVATVLSGTVIAQLLPAVMSTVFSRWFSPTQFGQFAVFQNMFNVSTSAVTGKFELGIVGAESDEEGLNLLNVGFVFGGIVSALVLLLGVTFQLLEVETLKHWLPLCLAVVSFAVFTPTNYWLIRKKEFKRISINKIVQTSSIIVFTVLFYLLDFTTALIFGYVLGWAGLMFFCMYQLYQTGYSIKTLNILASFQRMKEYKNYPLFNIIPGFLTNLAPFIVFYYLTLFFSEAIAGYVGHIKQYVFAPLSIISISISQVSMQSFSEHAKSGKKITPIILKLFGLLFVCAVPVVVVLNFFGEELFAFVFGEEWRVSGEYSKILSFGYSTIFIISPTSAVLVALRKVKEMALFPIVYFGLMSSLYFFRDYEIEDYLVVQTSLEICSYIFYFGLILWICFTHDRKLELN